MSDKLNTKRFLVRYLSPYGWNHLWYGNEAEARERACVEDQQTVEIWACEKLTLRPQPKESDEICVEDFCGSWDQPGFWADYYVNGHVTKFGGDWAALPDMHTQKRPTTAECWDWARKHGWLLRKDK